MITIGEEILLLALDYDTGGMNFRIPGRALQCALGGAVLTDLALAGRIDTDAGSLFPVDPAPLGEPAHDRPLERIVADGKRRTTDYWIAALSDDHATLRSLLMDRLVARGILCRGRYGRIWIMGAHRDAGEDGRPLRDVRQRLAGELMGSEIPDPRDIAIIGLADACDLWRGLLDEAALECLRPRIDLYARMDPVCQAVARATRGEPEPVRAQEAQPARRKRKRQRRKLSRPDLAVGFRALAPGGLSS